MMFSLPATALAGGTLWTLLRGMNILVGEEVFVILRSLLLMTNVRREVGINLSASQVKAPIQHPHTIINLDNIEERVDGTEQPQRN